jgi:hypothetical protein
MKSRYLQFLTAATLSFLFSCQKDTAPSFPAEQEPFVNVYIKLLLLQDRFPADYPALLDSTRKILQDANFTEQKYKQCLAYFNEEPERWEAFYQEVLKRLKEFEPSRSSRPDPSQNLNHHP